MVQIRGVAAHRTTYSVTFLLGLQQSLLLPYITIFAVRGLGLSAGELAGFLFCFYAMGLAANLALPAISDRKRQDLFLFRVLTCLAIVGFLGYAISRDFLIVGAISLLLTGPASAQNSLFFAFIRRVGSGAASVVVNRGIFTVAWVVGPLTGSVLVDFVGFAGLWISVAAVNLSIIGLSLLLPSRASTPPASPNPAEGRAYGKVAALFVVLVGLYASNVVATTIMPVVVTTELRLGSVVVGGLFAACATIESLVFLLLARRIERLNPRKTMLWACLPGAVYYLLLATASSWQVLLVAQIFNACFTTILVGVGMTWFQNTMPNRTGLATGLFMNTSRVAMLFAAPVIGLTVHAFGSYQSAAFTALALMSLAGLLLALPSRHMWGRLQHVAEPAPVRQAGQLSASVEMAPPGSPR